MTNDTNGSNNTAFQKEMMSALADAAVLYQPRLFAIHGLYKRREHGHILGWGMQFPDKQGTLYTDPSSCATHRSSTADGVFRTMRIIGDVRLTWLTEQQEGLADLVSDLPYDLPYAEED